MSLMIRKCFVVKKKEDSYVDLMSILTNTVTQIGYFRPAFARYGVLPVPDLGTS